MELLRLYLILNIAVALHSASSSAHSLHPTVAYSMMDHRDHTGISAFRVLNRRSLGQCPDPNPYLDITVSTTKSNQLLADEEYVKVTISGVLVPSELDWVGMISPSDSDVSACPLKKLEYLQTGDLAHLPLLCHYPVKIRVQSNTAVAIAILSKGSSLDHQHAILVMQYQDLCKRQWEGQLVSSDGEYLGCKKKQCQKSNGTICSVSTCNATITFHVVNFRTDVEFVFFTGGFDAPCILSRSGPFKFANPNQPLYSHISSVDSSATSMKVTWVSGSDESQQVKYGDGHTINSVPTTFTQDDMCSSVLPSPAKDFGWHDPGHIHSAIMTGLQPSNTYSFKYGSDSVGWSQEMKFKTPPAGGSDEVRFLAYGDMGKAPLDPSAEHYIQPGSLAVVKAMTKEVQSGNVDSIFHIGDISYATGFLVEWDYFLQLISPMASQVSYMTAIGNHERDYINTGSVYNTPDSGGECGVPYETYFPMPTSDKDKPWYSIEKGSVHFTVISTEHPWSDGSEQLEWMKSDLASVDRSKTPWLVFAGHRPMYSSSNPTSADEKFVATVEPLMQQYKVDVALFGHVHNYERMCSVYKGECLAMPAKDKSGVDIYDHNNYSAPVQAVIGMAGFKLDKFSDIVPPEKWSLRRIAEYGYLRAHATRTEFNLEFVNADTLRTHDSFRIIKSAD
ncbi:Probable inactive purple acid phosphatase 27 [Linum grandiflorum]